MVIAWVYRASFVDFPDPMCALFAMVWSPDLSRASSDSGGPGHLTWPLYSMLYSPHKPASPRGQTQSNKNLKRSHSVHPGFPRADKTSFDFIWFPQIFCLCEKAFGLKVCLFLAFLANRILVSAPVPFGLIWVFNWVGLGWDWVCGDLGGGGLGFGTRAW